MVNNRRTGSNIFNMSVTEDKDVEVGELTTFVPGSNGEPKESPEAELSNAADDGDTQAAPVGTPKRLNFEDGKTPFEKDEDERERPSVVFSSWEDGEFPERDSSGKVKWVRLINKNGKVNVAMENLPHALALRRSMYDFYTTMLDLTWTWIILIVWISLLFSWTFFGIIWYAIIVAHGDYMYEERFPEGGNETWIPCVFHTYDFTTSFLFSLETQTTIGYGYRAVTDVCPEAVLLVAIQTVMGVTLMGSIASIMAGKFIRPTRRCDNIKFSNQACISVVRDQLCLSIRICDLRETSRIICSSVFGVLVGGTISEKGINVKSQLDISFTAMKSSDQLLFIWPLTLYHVIDESSPLFGLTLNALEQKTFELIVVMDGALEVNGVAFRKMTSYLPSEIVWAAKFDSLRPTISHNKYKVDYSSFEKTIQSDARKRILYQRLSSFGQRESNASQL